MSRRKLAATRSLIAAAPTVTALVKFPRLFPASGDGNGGSALGPGLGSSNAASFSLGHHSTRWRTHQRPAWLYRSHPCFNPSLTIIHPPPTQRRHHPLTLACSPDWSIKLCRVFRLLWRRIGVGLFAIPLGFDRNQVHNNVTSLFYGKHDGHAHFCGPERFFHGQLFLVWLYGFGGHGSPLVVLLLGFRRSNKSTWSRKDFYMPSSAINICDS